LAEFGRPGFSKNGRVFEKTYSENAYPDFIIQECRD
jgi:hypothetical protein